MRQGRREAPRYKVRDTMHCDARAEARLRDSSISPALVASVARRIAAHYNRTDIAVRIATLPESAGDTASDIMSRASNGDEVWAICRRGEVYTIMLRRSTQPRTPDAFRVQRVYRLDGQTVRAF